MNSTHNTNQFSTPLSKGEGWLLPSKSRAGDCVHFAKFLAKSPKKFMVLTGLTLGLLMSSSATAEIKEKTFELGIFGGPHLFNKSQNLSNGMAYGARLGYTINENFGLELSTNGVKTNVDNRALITKKEGQFRSPINSVDLQLFSFDAIYHLKTEGELNPYIVTGIGFARYKPSISTHEMGVLNIGVGAKYWLGKDIVLRADLRDYMVTEFFQETYHNIQATLGISIAIGPKPKPTVVKPAPKFKKTSKTKKVEPEKVEIKKEETRRPYLGPKSKNGLEN